MPDNEYICIVCPRGCKIKAYMENGKVLRCDGNACPRGEKYVIDEAINPTRGVTTTVKIPNGSIPLLPVKTSRPVPKSLIFDIIKECNKQTVNPPVKIGDTIIKNVMDSGADIIATKSVD